MGKVVKKVAKVVNKIDPIGRAVDKQLTKSGLPTASDFGDMLGGAEPVETPPAGTGTATAEDQRVKDEQEAAALANRATAERAKQRRAGSLLASGSGSGGSGQTSSVLAYGKRTFGE